MSNENLMLDYPEIWSLMLAEELKLQRLMKRLLDLNLSKSAAGLSTITITMSRELTTRRALLSYEKSLKKRNEKLSSLLP